MASANHTSTMTIPKNGKATWTDIMQNPPKLPQGVSEGQYIVSSYAVFPDGVFVYGGVAVGPDEQDFNYALFMVFGSDCAQVGGWPIDTGDWEGFSVSSIDFSLTQDGKDVDYTLNVVEAG